MSFILDALRKSEIERQRQSGPSMAEFPIAREDRRMPIALIAIVVLLAVNVGVLLFFLLRDKAAPAAAATQVAVAAPASMTSAPPAGATAPALAPATPATTVAETPETISPLEAQAAGSDDYSESTPPIYGTQQSTLPPDAPDPTLLPEPAAPAHPGVVYGQAPTTEDASAVTAATGLPELTVDLHIYSENPAKRAVFINGRRYGQGDRIAEGPVVEQITREGAMLSYRGRRFLLPRL